MTSLASRVLAVAAVTLAVTALPAAASADVRPPAGPVGGAALGTTGVALRAAPGTPALPRLSASSFLLADLDTGDVLAARNPHGALRPASTLKVLTAVTLLPRLDPAATYTAAWEDANVEGSKAGVVPNATYTVHNLFQAMFLVSGNDAANSLANAAGGVPSTVAAMRETARGLGALDTRVVNPSGLDADGQVTSAYDLALFARAGLARDDFRTYVSTIKAQFPGKMPKAGQPRKTFEIYTQNRLVLNYDGAIGVKTGWTTKARGTFVGAATRGGRTLVATVMHTGPKAWMESAALLDWGFAHADAVTPVGTLNQPNTAVADAAAPVAKKRSSVGVTAAAAAGSGSTVPWYLWPVATIALLVTALRARVHLDQRRRRVNHPVAKAPAAAPSRSGRQRDEPVAAGAPPTGTGTGS